MFLFFACAGPAARAEIGITNTLPRAGAGEQGRAAIGRRRAAPISHVCRNRSLWQAGGCEGQPRPLNHLQMKGEGCGKAGGVAAPDCCWCCRLAQGSCCASGWWCRQWRHWRWCRAAEVGLVVTGRGQAWNSAPASSSQLWAIMA